MTRGALTKNIYQYIDTADDKILKAVYTILEEHARSKEEHESMLTKKQKAELDKTLADHKAGKLKYYTTGQVKQAVAKALKK